MKSTQQAAGAGAGSPRLIVSRREVLARAAALGLMAGGLSARSARHARHRADAGPRRHACASA